MLDYIVLILSIIAALLYSAMEFRTYDAKRETASREVQYQNMRKKIGSQLDIFGVSNRGISMDKNVDDFQAYEPEEIGL